MKVSEWNVLKMVVFRENMGSKLFLQEAERIFGVRSVAQLDEKIKRLLVSREENPVAQEKIRYAKANSGIFRIFDLVRFIGVSGSVAAGTAKEDDDIDVFVVVRDGTGWLYRGLLLIRNLFNRKIRMGGGLTRHEGAGGRFRDKFCINLIVEERGLAFDQDIFIFHELFHLVPVYNPDFLSTILSHNSWVSRYGGHLTKQKEEKSHDSGVLLSVLNYIFFALQLLYRLIVLHPTNLRSILANYRKGKIIFYPDYFRGEILELFEKRYKQRVEGIFGPKADSDQ
jgi:hypothetical protein